MEPRLSRSIKWSPIPEELVQQIRSVFKQNFAAHIGGGQVHAKGRIFPEEILLSLGFRPEGALKQSNFMISIGYNQAKDNVMKLLHLAMDAGAALFEQFFTAENDQDFPRIWEEVTFEGRKMYVQYNTENFELEAEADRLLGEATDSNAVAQGDWDEDMDPKKIKAQLGVGEEE